jgi:heme-degrading monooxygenase HmoA
MIARIWRGATRAEDRDEYLEYLHRTGLAGYAATEGNQGAAVLCRLDEEKAEFLVLSLWESLDVIQGFAGADVEKAVFFPEDDRFLIERDLSVSHYELLAGVGIKPEAG